MDVNFILNFIWMCIIVAALLGFISVTVMLLIWLERKISGHIQTRFGPMRVGWHGSLQPIADTIKLLLKENIVPSGADRIIYFLAPVIVFTSAFLAYVCIPFGKGIIARDLNVGILYILAVTSLGVISILMAGWSSNNKYSLLGSMRSAAQIVSYEVPMILSVIGVIMASGSLSMSKIVESQSKGWFVFAQPLGFLIYLTCAFAETNRAPFDIPEAESELVAGFHTEYSGMKFAMFFLAEYANMFTVSAIAAALFLGGWQAPAFISSEYLSAIKITGVFWFLIKVYAVLFFMMWVRWTWPRLRVDQLMKFAWKVMLPLAFLNIVIIAARALMK